MPREFTCPACGETENLTGQRSSDGIHLTCGACGATWPRDSTRTCATCSGHDLHDRPQALTQYSRGTQLSITGWHQVPLCAACDAGMLTRTGQGKPVPPGYRPAATTPRGPGDPSPGPASSTQILPQ